MQLKDRDISLLTTISNLRFMTTQQIHSIHGYSGKYGENVTRRKLKELESKGFLKSWKPDIYSSKVFYLTKAGAKEVELYNGYDNVKTFQKSNQTLHHVMVTEVYVQLKKAGVKLRRFVIHPKVGEIEADAFIEYLEGNSLKVIFLEADRATETLQVLTEKLEEYKKVYESDWYQKRLGNFPRVAFVTSTEARRRALIRLLEKYPYRNIVMSESELRTNPRGLIE
jgi:hypothetical protein